MKKILIAIILIFFSGCRTVYIAPELPEHNGGSVNFKEFNPDSKTDMEKIILIQNDIIKGWEDYYENLKILFKRGK